MCCRVVRKDAHDVGATLDLGDEPFLWIGAVQLLSVRFGKRHVCLHSILAAAHARRDLGVLFAQLISDQAPLLVAFG